MKLLVILICFFATQIALAFDFSKDKDKIYKIGVEDHYYPFSFLEKGKREGFDIDFAKILCNNLEIKCEIVPMQFPKLFDAIKKDEIDIIVAGVGKTEERAKFLAFSNTYYRSKTIAINSNDEIKTTDPQILQLQNNNYTICSQKHTLQDDLIKRIYGPYQNISIQSYQNYKDVFAALQNKKCDIAFMDGLSSYEYLKKLDSKDLLLVKIHPSFNVKTEEAKIVLSIKNAHNIDEINAVINKLQLNGVYQKLSSKYFPFSIY